MNEHSTTRCAAPDDIGRIGAGDHLCCIDRNSKDRRGVVVPFLARGLENNERCLYVVDESSREDIIRAFRNAGIDLGQPIAAGRFVLLTGKESYLKGGSFDPDRMIATLKGMEADAIREGFSGLRITGEMTWVFSGLPGVERLIEYEAKLNNFFPGSRSCAICQYNEERFDPEILIDVIHTHPNVVIDGKLVQNPYYVPCEEFLLRLKGERIPPALYRRMRDDILARGASEEAGRRIEEQTRAMLERSERSRRAMLSVLEDRRRAEDDYRALFEETRDIIYTCTPAGRLTDINPAGVETFGFGSKGEMLGANISELYWNPGDRAEVLARLHRDGFLKDFELAMRTRDGTRLFMRLTVTIARDQNGRVVSYRVIARDFTEQKRLARQIQFAEKMAAIGELLAGVAHELNNPLTAVMGFAELLLKTGGDLDEHVRSDLRQILDATIRMHNITGGILRFARRERPVMERIDVNRTVAEALALKEYHMRTNNIEIRQNLTDGLSISGDANQLEQVFLNLINNAEHAMLEKEQRGVLTVRTLREDEHVKIEFQDTGPGVPEDRKDRLFDPFFTTKPPGQGTGLGLSVSYGIVSEHGGWIDADNRKEGGAVFTVVVPSSGTVATDSGGGEGGK